VVLLLQKPNSSIVNPKMDGHFCATLKAMKVHMKFRDNSIYLDHCTR
jgi:hypothetical protein